MLVFFTIVLGILTLAGLAFGVGYVHRDDPIATTFNQIGRLLLVMAGAMTVGFILGVGVAAIVAMVIL